MARTHGCVLVSGDNSRLWAFGAFRPCAERNNSFGCVGGYRETRRHRWRRREAGGSGASDSSRRTPSGRPCSETRSITYPLSSSSPMTTAGKVNPTGPQLVERHWLLARAPCRSSIRSCWVSTSAIDRIPRHILPGASRRGPRVIDGRGSTPVGDRRGRAGLSTALMLTLVEPSPSPCVDPVAHPGLDQREVPLGVLRQATSRPPPGRARHGQRSPIGFGRAGSARGHSTVVLQFAQAAAGPGSRQGGASTGAERP
jgi:hypothetical protein